MKTKIRNRLNKQKLLYVSIIILILQVVNSKNCVETIKDSFTHFSLTNMTNPLTSSGLGYNDMGKYDACLLTPASKYMTFKLNVYQTKPQKAKTIFHMGLCLPEECVTKEIAGKVVDYLVNNAAIPREDVEVIIAQDENNSVFQMDV